MTQLSSAEPATRAPAPPQTGKVRQRPDPVGPPVALRNWRVPWRLIALIVIPTAMGMIFAGLRVAVADGSASTFGRVERLAALGQQVTGLAQAMEDERDRTAVFTAAGRPAAGLPALRKQYLVTDAWATRVRTLARGIGAGFPTQTRAAAVAVLARIADLPELRSYADGSQTPALTVIPARHSALLTGAAALTVLLFVLLATVIIARSMVRPLRRRRVHPAESAEVARNRLAGFQRGSRRARAASAAGQRPGTRP